MPLLYMTGFLHPVKFTTEERKCHVNNIADYIFKKRTNIQMMYRKGIDKEIGERGGELTEGLWMDKKKMEVESWKLS